MEELVDLIATDASPSDVSDKIKDALMAKAAARIDAFKPAVAADVFGDAEYEEGEVESELEVEDETTIEPEETDDHVN